MPEGMVALRDEGLMRITSSEFHGVIMMVIIFIINCNLLKLYKV